MQSLGLNIVEMVKKEKMKKLEFDLQGVTIGEMIICPVCNYVGKNKKGSAKVFKDSFKCFSCGIWRKING